MKGLSDKDFMFWKPEITEDLPEEIIKQSFIKPFKGDVNIILQASAGEFGPAVLYSLISR